jgi:molybdenum-dependent DNA-binding transcriptional regulator ModE
MDSLDWSLVPSLLAVADHGSLSAAARATGLSQPTLGRHVALAESRLGLPLFTRVPRGLRPTEALQALLPAARAMATAAHALNLAAAGREVQLKGTVRLTASRILGAHVLPPILADLRAAEPEIEIELVPSDRQENLMQHMANPSRHAAGGPGVGLLILAGDGIGPEVMAEVKKIIGWMGAKRGVHFDVSEDLVGGCAYDAHGTPLTDATMAKAQAVDAVLLGAVGGPKYDKLDFSVKPERGLLRLRKEMDLFSPTCARRSALTRWPISPVAQARGRRRSGYRDRARTDLGRLFRRTARHLQGRQRARGHQHPALYRIRNRPRGALGVRTGPQAQQQGLLDGEGQCDGIGHPVARGGAGGA